MDLIDTTFAKIHNIYKDYFWQEKPYEKSVDEFYELKTKIQTILKIYSDESIPLELQVKPEIAEVIEMIEEMIGKHEEMRNKYIGVDLDKYAIAIHKITALTELKQNIQKQFSV